MRSASVLISSRHQVRHVLKFGFQPIHCHYFLTEMTQVDLSLRLLTWKFEEQESICCFCDRSALANSCFVRRRRFQICRSGFQIVRCEFQSLIEKPIILHVEVECVNVSSLQGQSE